MTTCSRICHSLMTSEAELYLHFLQPPLVYLLIRERHDGWEYRRLDIPSLMTITVHASEVPDDGGKFRDRVIHSVVQMIDLIGI